MRINLKIMWDLHRLSDFAKSDYRFNSFLKCKIMKQPRKDNTLKFNLADVFYSDLLWISKCLNKASCLMCVKYLVIGQNGIPWRIKLSTTILENSKSREN